MASREDWCAEKLTNLLVEDLRVSTLNEIKDHLTSIPHDEASRTAKILQLPLVFDCLNDSNVEQVDLACEVLSLCLNNLSLGESTDRYGVSLERALIHPNSGVKLMALKEVERNIAKEEVLSDLCKRVSLLINVIQCIADSDLAVVKKSSEIITIVGLSHLGIKQLTSSDVLKALHEIMMMDEVIRLRVYELFIDISKDSEPSFNVLKSSGLITTIFKELDNSDILVKTNIIELLTRLGLSRHGYSYLESNGILTKLFGLFDSNEDPVSSDLCEPVILKFFGNIAHWKPLELLSKYPQVFDRIFANIESRDLIIVGISLDTLGHIGKTNEGKIALETTGNKIVYAIKTIIKLLSSLPTETRIRALNCLENLIRIDDFKTEISNICRKWYILFGDSPLEVILKYAKNPFSELRLAGFGIVKAITGHHWGQEEIKNSAGLVEFLLDRNVETIKKCKEAKYEIVKILSTSDIFDHLTLKRLQAFVKEGPFYVQALTEVATEGNE